MKELFFFACTGLLLLHLLTLFGKSWWFLELFTHYNVYYTLATPALILLAIPLKAWKAMLVLVTILSFNLANFAPYLKTLSQNAQAEPILDTISILSQNFYTTNDNFEEIQNLLAENVPDIFIIHEAGPQWKSALSEFAENYPYLYITAKTGIQGIALGSKNPGDFKEIPLGSKFGLEFISNSQSYRILAVHPIAPLSKDFAVERNAQFTDIASYVKLSTLPTLVVGDFNATPWSPHFKELLENSGLADARLGFGLIPTWHAHNFLFRLPIDYVLTTAHWKTLSFKRTAKTSSDHWGIFAELKL